MTERTLRGRVPVLASGAMFLAMLDATVMSLAVSDLHADLPRYEVATLTWAITLYAVCFAALLAPAGRLADLVGRRVLFQAGVGLFTLASLGCAVAPDLPVLLVTRGVQGAAAAAMIPASLALLLHDTPPERRASAIGLWSAAGSLAAALGPVVGGLLVGAFGWRSLFVINLPVGVAMVAAGVRLPRGVTRRGPLPDVLGTAALGLGVGGFALGVTRIQDGGWQDPGTPGLLGGGLLLVAWALWRSFRHPVPAVETSLWRSRGFAVANLASALYGAALFPWLLVCVLFLTERWRYSVAEAGMASTPGALTATAAALVIGRLIGRTGARVAVVGGALTMAAAGTWVVAGISDEPRFLTYWLPIALVMGTGMGAVTTGTSTAAALSVEPARFAGATGLNTTARQLGGAVGVAVVAAVLPAGAVTGDFATVFGLIVAASLGAAVAGLWLAVPPRRPQPTTGAGPVEVTDTARRRGAGAGT